MKLLTRDAFPNQYKQPKKLNIGKQTNKQTNKQTKQKNKEDIDEQKNLKRYSAALITKKCKSKLL